MYNIDKVEEVLEELYEAGYLIGENQYSGDLSKLITVEQALRKIEELQNDPIQIKAENEEREYRSSLLEAKNASTETN